MEPFLFAFLYKRHNNSIISGWKLKSNVLALGKIIELSGNISHLSSLYTEGEDKSDLKREKCYNRKYNFINFQDISIYWNQVDIIELRGFRACGWTDTSCLL